MFIPGYILVIIGLYFLFQKVVLEDILDTLKGMGLLFLIVLIPITIISIIGVMVWVGWLLFHYPIAIFIMSLAMFSIVFIISIKNKENYKTCCILACMIILNLFVLLNGYEERTIIDSCKSRGLSAKECALELKLEKRTIKCEKTGESRASCLEKQKRLMEWQK